MQVLGNDPCAERATKPINVTLNVPDIHRIIHASDAPNADAQQNSSGHGECEFRNQMVAGALEVAMLTAAAKINRATPSFSRLSPFKTLTMRRGSSARASMAAAAAASGGATIAPNAIAASQRHSLQRDRGPRDGRGGQNHCDPGQCDQRPPVPPQLAKWQVECRIEQAPAR